jgi:DNA repair photolyase
MHELRSRWVPYTDESIQPKDWIFLSEKHDLTEKATGCPVGCIYCNQPNFARNELRERIPGLLAPSDAGLSINLQYNFGSKIIGEQSIAHVINLLKSYPLYNNEGSIVIGNYTDPGLNWIKSTELAKSLVTELNHQGPINFITKMPIGKVASEKLVGLKNMGGKVVVIVSYSGMPQAIEPVNPQKRIQAIRTLESYSIPVILSMRPMVPNINGKPETIKEVLMQCGKHANAIIFGGLFVFDDTRELFEKSGYQLPINYANNKYPVAKVDDPTIGENIREIAEILSIKKPIYEHTNCAISFIMQSVYNRKQHSKLAPWAIPLKTDEKNNFNHCRTICPPEQLAVCHERSVANPEEIIHQIQGALIKLKLAKLNEFNIVKSEKIDNLYLINGACFNTLQLFQVMEIIGVRIDNLPNEQQFIMRASEGLNEYLNKFNSKDILGAILLGQEWVLLVNRYIDAENNELASKFVRTTTRCRSNVLNIKLQNYPNEFDNWLQEKGYLKYKSTLLQKFRQLPIKFLNY